MNVVANTASLIPSSTESPRVAAVVAEELSKADVHDVAAQLFTVVLAEQTLKTPKVDLLQVKSSELIAPKSEPDGRPASKLKKTVSNDAPIQVVSQLAALALPIVVESAFVLPSSPLNRIGQSGNDQPKIGLVDDSSKKQNIVEVEVPTHPLPELSLRPDLSAPAATANLVAEPKVITSIPIAEEKVFASTPIAEQKITAVTEEKVIASTPVAEPKAITSIPIADEKVIASTPVAEPKVNTSIPIADEKVIASTPVAELKVNTSTPIAEQKMTPITEQKVVPSTPVIDQRKTPVAHVTQTAPAPSIASASPSHSQSVTPSSLPISPISALIPGPVPSSVSSTPPVGHSLAHAINIGALAQAISRPINEGNGGYSVQVTMHPAELGHLQAIVTLRGNDLQVSITPQTQLGREALASTAHTLKEELSRGGLNVNVTLHDSGFQPRGEDRPASPARRFNEVLPHEELAPQVLPSPISAANQIDLRL